MLSGGSTGFDSHAHLHFNHFDHDLEQVLERAALSGISHVMIPSVDLATAIKSAEIAEKHNCYSAAAFHPEHLPTEDADKGWREIRKVLMRPRTVAAGETGLDFHHETFSRDVQRHWFRKHIELAESIGYPLIVHSRDAEEEVLARLPEKPSVPVILHCWSGGKMATEKAVSRGFYIGVGGPLTYRKNTKRREIAAGVPSELILAETDSPFLAPEPFRGKRNEPAHARLVVERLRELQGFGQSIEGVSFMLWENALRAFLLHPLARRADIVYRYDRSAYINITSRCCNSCIFCAGRTADGVGGNYLRHREDPGEDLVLSTLDAFPLEDFGETVFCGLGEPSLRSGLVVKCSERLSRRGVTTRLNTNGLCTSFMGDEAVLELIRAVDSVSISLNASAADEYRRICRPSLENAWEHLMKFIRLVRQAGVKATLTAVKGSGADIPRVESMAGRLGLPFRVR